MSIYLVSKLVTDCMENKADRALYYEKIGYVTEPSIVPSYMIKPDCWAAFDKEYPVYKIEELKRLTEIENAINKVQAKYTTKQE